MLKLIEAVCTDCMVYTSDESSRIAYHTMKKNITKKTNDGKMNKNP